MLSRHAVVVALLLVAGCSSTTSNIDIHDSSVAIPTVRIAVDIGEKPGPPSHVHTGHAVELGVTGAKGNDTFNISPGQQPIVFGGTIFAVPQEVRAEFDFRFTELAYRYRYLSQRRGLGF